MVNKNKDNYDVLMSLELANRLDIIYNLLPVTLTALELGKTKTIFNTKLRSQSISVLSQEFTTQYTITASDRDREEAETESEIHKINFDYYFQPSDVIKDESDLVELKEK